MFALVAAILFWLSALLIVIDETFIAVAAMFFISMGFLCLHFAYAKPAPTPPARR